MKFKEDDILYYINPVVFNIELVKIDMAYIEGEELYYIDSTNAYLREPDLFEDLKDAQRESLKRLEKYCCEMRYRILNDKPEFHEGILE
jgi:hypothetical protein